MIVSLESPPVSFYCARLTTIYLCGMKFMHSENRSERVCRQSGSWSTRVSDLAGFGALRFTSSRFLLAGLRSPQSPQGYIPNRRRSCRVAQTNSRKKATEASPKRWDAATPAKPTQAEITARPRNRYGHNIAHLRLSPTAKSTVVQPRDVRMGTDCAPNIARPGHIGGRADIRYRLNVTQFHFRIL